MTSHPGHDDWLQLIAATDYLADLERPGLTVADGIEEALRWWTDVYLDPDDGPNHAPPEVPWDDPDPLRTTVERLLSAVPAAGAYDGRALTDVLVDAISSWVRIMAIECNEGHTFTAPRPSSEFPAPTLVW